jgi:cell division septal protein FtsQ
MKIKLFKKNKRKSVSRKFNDEYQKQQIYSYRSSRKEMDRPYNREDEEESSSRSIISKAKIYLFTAVIIFASIYMSILTPNANVKLRGESAILRAESLYQDEINKQLKNSLFNFSKLTLDKNKLAIKIKSSFPEAQFVNVSTPLFGRHPAVEIGFAKPIAMLVTGENNYILDSEGRVLISEAEASDAINTSGLITIVDNSTQKITVGKHAMTAEQIGYLYEIVEQAKNKNSLIESVSLSGNGLGIQAKYKDADYLVKYSFLANSRQSSGAFFAMRDYLTAKGVSPNEYIDIRIPDRAYIK